MGRLSGAMIKVAAFRGHRRADRARVGDPARLQQPRGLASGRRRVGDRGRRARRPGRLRAQLPPAGRQPHPRAAAGAVGPRPRLDLLHPRRHAAAAPVCRHGAAQARHRRRPHLLALAVDVRRAARPRAASSPTWSASGVYEAGFEGLPDSPAPVAARRRRSRSGRDRRAGAATACSSRATAGRSVLRCEPVSAPPPGPGEVRIRHTAIGVNYIDVYVRTGLYPLLAPPAPLGMEAAGIVRRRRRRGRAPAARRPRRLCLPAARRLRQRPDAAGRPGGGAAGRRRRGDRRRR